MTHRTEQGERGAAALSLLTVAIILALAIFTVMALPLTRASDAKAKGNSAADAAALAGVEWIRLDLRDALTTRGWLGSWDAYRDIIGGGLGSAQDYASRNGATLVSYHADLLHLEVYAKVRGRVVDGHTTESEATARLQLPTCTTKPDDTPPSDDDPKPGEDDKPPPVKFTCDGIDITIHPGKDDPGKLDLPASIIDQLLNNSHAKLVS
ncbi:MAG: hypothetical protein QOJ72_2057 [Nocardioidaceae bacterium]|jgi:hypothetical protein|nr:hypothetical protein [Nocardioidaceae bacterium]